MDNLAINLRPKKLDEVYVKKYLWFLRIKKFMNVIILFIFKREL